MRRVSLVLALVIAGACGGARTSPQASAEDQLLPPGAERAYRSLSSRFDRAAAMDVVAFMQQYWRLAGNPGYNASIDHIRDRLRDAGMPVFRVEEYPNPSRGWDYSVGTLRIEGDPEPVLSKERDRVSLAINSFSTPAAGLRARLVDVGAGQAADFEGKDVEDAVVLGDASLGVLWRESVRNRGAAGVISTQIASYIRPADSTAMTETQKDVLQWGSVPYDEQARAFGFKASYRAGERLRAALAADPAASVTVEVASSFYTGPSRTLVAEIPGRTKPDERIVLVAHVQEPGANDNASGSATLYGLARALQDAIRRGALPQPDRTLTFLWLDEIRGSRQWIDAHPDDAKGVKYMFSMDMTGEDTDRTGGTFLIEKQADPTAVWPRPSDPNSEWGAGNVKADALAGSLLNDLHIAVANRRARDTGWVVRTNPYEGGSDHTVFATAGVPSLLNWHFTDRFYHTNQDTIDKVSAAEMENVAITVATSAYFLASASEEDAIATIDLVERAARARFALERRQGAEIVAAAGDRQAAERTEGQLLDAWRRWYAEALESVGGLPPGGASSALRSRIDAARAALSAY